MRPRNLLPLLLLFAAAAQAQPLPIVLPDPLPVITASDTAVIGELVRLNAPDGTKHKWVVVPKTIDFEAAGVRAFFSARTEGEWTFVCGYLDATDEWQMTTHELTVGEGGPLPPPIPGQLVKVVVVEETADRTPEQAEVVLDTGWRKTLETAGIEWRMIDDDVTTETDTMPPDLKQAIKSARGYGLPAVVCLGEGGRVLSVEGLPETVAAMGLLIAGKVKEE